MERCDNTNSNLAEKNNQVTLYPVTLAAPPEPTLDAESVNSDCEQWLGDVDKTNSVDLQTSTINIENSGDVIIGPLTQFHGPVTIYQNINSDKLPSQESLNVECKAEIVINGSAQFKEATMEMVENNQQSAAINKQDRNKKLFNYKLQSGDEDLLRPLIHHFSVPERNTFRKMVKLFSYWMDVPEDKLALISDIVYNLYNMTLIIDDMQDSSPLRRCVPAAHTIFGIDNVVNACSFHGYGLYDIVLQLNHPKALRLYLDIYLTLFRGQGMELYWRENSMCPTEEEYERMVLRKSRVMFLAINHMQLFAKKHVDLGRFMTNLTLYLQIRNDYDNLNSDVVFQEKGFCEDLTEGKFGHPTMHAVNSNPQIGKEIIKILKLRTTDLKKLKECRSLIEKGGGFQYTKDKLNILKANILQELTKLGNNPMVNEFLTKVIR